MPNRLQDATSSYLLQHADNPVDWWEWSDEAFDEAGRRDVPVLLSVGYASCHWCHVMARESFTDPQTADFINERFVPIKVDREERPDVDAVYMTATQALTGAGGWPMTVFLTADGAPFFAGTYFPPQPAGGHPSFRQVLSALSEAWVDNRGEVLGSAGRIRAALADMTAALPAGSLDAPALDRAAATVLGQVDRVDGGFGGAPKFPPAMVCEFLLRHHERTGSADALDVVTLTCEKMSAGGMFDQLGGGFARYSVDKYWRVPHFEKMLEDNALLLGVYSHHARLTGSVRSREIALATGDFVLDTLRTDDGLFAASVDAEAAGAEGSTYLWTAEEVRRVLGPSAARALDLFGMHDGPGDQVISWAPRSSGLETAADLARAWTAETAPMRASLLAVRDQRPQPGRDDIVVLRSNALMIAALAESGGLFDRPDWIAAAAAARRALDLHRVDGGWRHSSRHGRVGPAPATLADHADLALAGFALFQATGEPSWSEQALDLVAHARTAFAAEAGGFYDTVAGGLIVRPRDPTDGAAPSGASSMADALLTAAALTGSSELRAAADAALASVARLVEQFPRSAGKHLAVAEAAQRGPLQIAIAGPAGPAGVDRVDLVSTARRLMPGGSVLVAGEPDAPGIPLLADRPLVADRAAAYVCRGFVCDRPVTNPDDLAAALAR